MNELDYQMLIRYGVLVFMILSLAAAIMFDGLSKKE